MAGALTVIVALAAGWVSPPAALTHNVADVRSPAGSAIAVNAEGVIINEVGAASSISDADSFFELRNDSAIPVDLNDWSVYRCDVRGLRVGLGRPEVSLTGVVLAPGEIFTAAHMSARRAAGVADARFAQAYSSQGLGLVLVDPAGHTVDSVAMYPNEPWPTYSECGEAPNLPATLAAALDESWQRTAHDTWIRAESTPGLPNAAASEASAVRDVVIDEISPAGPGGSGDDMVELRNRGIDDVNIAGWHLYRCTGRGEARSDTLQISFPEDALLRAGERLLIAGPQFTQPGIDPDFRVATSLSDVLSGVLLVDGEGRRVDGVSVSSHADTACQTGDDKLDAGLDHRSGESWQRGSQGSYFIAPRTPGRANAASPSARAATDVGDDDRGVRIGEFAADPVIPDPARSPSARPVARSHFVEVTNYADSRVDVSGWRLIGCDANGFLRRDDLGVIPEGTLLAPGETWLAALEGTEAAVEADAVFDVALDFRGAGAWLEDDQGRRVDGVGTFHVNVLDRSVDTPSACTSGLTLPVFAADRVRGETYQRVGDTGDNTADFIASTATPGSRSALGASAPDELVSAAALRLAPELRTTRSAGAIAPVPLDGEGATVLTAFVGASDGPLPGRVGAGERSVSAPSAELLVSRDDGYDFPYVRFTVAADFPMTLEWTGTATGPAEVVLSVWEPGGSRWRELDRVAPAHAPATPVLSPSSVVLRGALGADDLTDGTAELLVQSVPRSESALAADEGLAAPSRYDFAITHLTDTQYLSEAYPDVYANVIGWVIANSADRKIAFASHTGDLIQSWVDPNQTEERARREFGVASAMQAELDAAGVANSVLPGNHDTKRGISPALFNEYFGPNRYVSAPWYGGSIAPDDNSANFSTFVVQGAQMLMLSLPYAYGEREIAWAERIVEAHPDHNVVVSTHEHLTPKTADEAAHRSNSSRWVSQADALWERVIAPNRQVVLVLSGHFHGLGSIVTENAGGIEGHTVLEALADYQEFRTHSGERATGFMRLLQVDIGAGRIAVDALSSTVAATSSAQYDYEQFVPENGHADRASNDRPWNLVARGLQERYTTADDHFTVDVRLQYAKGFETSAVVVAPR